MGRTIILTDSNCDIPSSLLNSNIMVMPLTICMGNEEYFLENEISKKKFNAILDLGIKIQDYRLESKTIKDTLDSLDKDVKDIIILTSSEMLSHQNDIAIQDAVYEYSVKHINSRIIRIDSGTTSMALGLLVLDASKMIDVGYFYEDIVNYILKYKNKYCIDVVPRNIDCLENNRAISSHKANLVRQNKKHALFSLSYLGLFKPIAFKNHYSEIDDIMVDRVVDNYVLEYALVKSYGSNSDEYIGELISESTLANKINSVFSCSNTSIVGTDSYALCYKKR